MKKRLEVLAAIMALLTAALMIPNLVGQPARLVDLIALFASGFGAGATLTAIAQSRRRAASTR